MTRLEAPEDVLLYECVARDNPADRGWSRSRRCASSPSSATTTARVTALPHAERAVENCLEAIRRARTERGAAGAKLDMNHVWVHVWPVVDADHRRSSPPCRPRSPRSTDGAGIEEVLAQGRRARPRRRPRTGSPSASMPAGVRRRHHDRGAAHRAAQAARRLRGKVLRARRRGLVYPYELEALLTGPDGTLVEHDLDDTGALVPVDRPRGRNKAGDPGRRGHHADRRCTPRASPGWCLRRPDQGAGRGLGAGVRADHRRDRPRRADAGAGGVVRALRGRPDLDGLRHREHGLGGAPPSSGSSSSPRTAARSTSSWPASTWARSRTGTPRPRC